MLVTLRPFLFSVSVLLPLWAVTAQTSRLSARNTFQDDRIRVAVPPGWRANEVTLITGGAYHVPIHVGGVLSKGKYRVYLLTHYGQASGIVGGRFGEIANYVAPWINTDDPGGCFNYLEPFETPATKLLSRVDLYFDSASQVTNKNESCQDLHSPAQHLIWFGSYFSPRNDKYAFFLTFPLGQTDADPDRQMAFTATLATKSPDDLPVRNDPELKRFLDEASAVISSITYR